MRHVPTNRTKGGEEGASSPFAAVRTGPDPIRSTGPGQSTGARGTLTRSYGPRSYGSGSYKPR
ncbi:hypothetical protein GCM10009603_17540 [Nocardiopsis exhalans]